MYGFAIGEIGRIGMGPGPGEGLLNSVWNALAGRLDFFLVDVAAC